MSDQANYLVCDTSDCIGCRLCQTICPVQAIQVRESADGFVPGIEAEKCLHCQKCFNRCPSRREFKRSAPQKCFQGWALESEQRISASSGGAASALAQQVFDMGGYVTGCIYTEGMYRIRLFSNMEDYTQCRGSKYVRSMMDEQSYTSVAMKMKERVPVLFIGLPCQVAAIKSYLGEIDHSDFYTAELICHGTPSMNLLTQCLQKEKLSTNEMKKLKFRIKERFGLTVDEKSIFSESFDYWIKPFLEALDYYDICYHCRFANINRISDITLGDSWGSELPKEEREKGISLILCNTEKGCSLVEKAQLHLESVDLKRAIRANGQLTAPSKMTEKRDKFIKTLRRSSFDNAVRYCFPIELMKEPLRRIKRFFCTDSKVEGE